MTTETQPPPPSPPSMKTPAEEVRAGQGRLERRTDGPRTDADESVDGQITGVDLMVRSGFREYEVKNCVLT